MILRLLALFGIILILFGLYAAYLPADFRVERSVTINAPKNVIFPHFNNLQKLDVWNPFSKSDPNLKMVYAGPAEGVGARASWEGNAQAGSGAMEIIESVPDERVKMRLDFRKPFEGTNYTQYSLTSQGDQTSATWMMEGKMAFIPRAISVFFSMDKMMGRMFEQGLAQVKTLSEAEAKR
jgi:hypothetical protein